MARPAGRSRRLHNFYQNTVAGTTIDTYDWDNGYMLGPGFDYQFAPGWVAGFGFDWYQLYAVAHVSRSAPDRLISNGDIESLTSRRA